MTGEMCAGASRTVAALRIAHRAVGHNSDMRGPAMGPSGHWAYSWEACAGSAAWLGSVAVAGGRWEAPQASQPDWSRRHRSHCRDWAQVHLNMPDVRLA